MTLAAIKERLKKVTPTFNVCCDCSLVEEKDATVCQNCGHNELLECVEYHFISHAPTDIAHLIQAVEVMREALERIKADPPSTIDGMIIADMRLKHFTGYTATNALSAVDEILGEDK